MPLLGRQLGSDFFDAELTTLCIKWLADPVFSIREAAAANLHKLAEVRAFQWTRARPSSIDPMSLSLFPSLAGAGVRSCVGGGHHHPAHPDGAGRGQLPPAAHHAAGGGGEFGVVWCLIFGNSTMC